MNIKLGINWTKSAIALALLCAVFSFGVMAQIAELRGQVFMTRADGQKDILPDARVDVFRTDISGIYNARTNKKGEFFLVVPFVGVYIVAISHPLATPNWVGGVKAGRGVPIEITIMPGDGRRLKLEEIQPANGKSTTLKDSPKTETPQQTETPKKNVEPLENDENADEMETVRIYVGNLSPETTEDVLQEAFEEFGEVKSVKIERDADGKSKGFGYVEMVADEAEEAISALNGSELNGKNITVKKAQ